MKKEIKRKKEQRGDINLEIVTDSKCSNKKEDESTLLYHNEQDFFNNPYHNHLRRSKPKN